MSLSPIDTTLPTEPDWRRLLPRKAEREIASEHWRAITQEMERQQTIGVANGHAVMRLVLARVMHDRAAAKAMRSGPVNEPAKGNQRAIPRPSLYFAAMREAGAIAAQLEADLGLSPRTRNRVGKLPQPKRVTGASRFLRAVPSLPHPEPLAPTTLNPVTTTPDKEPTQ